MSPPRRRRLATAALLALLAGPASAQDFERTVLGLVGEVSAYDDVEVRAASGVVHLEGVVRSQEERERLVAAVERLDGVLLVDDQLEVTPTPTLWVTRADIDQVTRRVLSWVPALAAAVGLLLGAAIVSRAVQRTVLVRRFAERPLLRVVVQRTAGLLVWGVAVVGALEVLDLTGIVAALLGTAGVAGLALGFAFEDIVENYLATSLLSLRQPFRKGDLVHVAGHTGSVARTTTRDTVLLTFDGNHVRIPNAQVFRSVLVNYSTAPTRRFDFVVGVGTEDDLLAVRARGLDVLRGVGGVLDEPAPFMLVDELGDSSVSCHFYGWPIRRPRTCSRCAPSASGG